MEGSNHEHDAARSASFGWIVAVILVMVAWMAAVAWRAGGEKAVLEGWADGMPAGQQLAEETDRPMVVLFTAGWCGPCQSMKKNVLTQSDVAGALQDDFVPVQIDLTDQSASNPNVAVAQRYGVSRIPAVIAMTHDGQPIDAYQGGNSVAGFKSWLAGLPRGEASASLR